MENRYMEGTSMASPKLTLWQSTKFISLASAGFIVDGYLNLVIGLITPMLGYLYYADNNNALPANVNDAVSGITNVGFLVGQLTFGLFSDRFGRSAVYGKELMITSFGTLMVSLTPTQLPSASVMAWIGFFRFITGVGIGGDYPVTGAITIERRLVNWRGAMIGTVFMGQAVGRLVCAIVLIILVYALKERVERDIKQLEYVWRLLLALGIIPAMTAVYWRLKLRETVGYKAYVAHADSVKRTWSDQWKEFRMYFSTWKHIKVLLACAIGWCLYDVAFYGINLNQGTVLTAIGIGSGSTPWETFKNQAIGNLITSVVSGIAGNLISLPTLDPMGRVRTQTVMAFLSVLFYGVWAGCYNTLGQKGFVAMYWMSSLCLNYLSQTTYIIPTEVFPTRVRSTAHGICAATGKVGAIISGFAFGTAKEKIGFTGLLWLFCGCVAVEGILCWWIPEASRLTLDELETDIIDLPGTYGLSLWSRGLIPPRVDYKYGQDLQSSVAHSVDEDAKEAPRVVETEV